MKLFVAYADFNYEGQDVIGIYDSEQAAKDAADNHRYKNGELRGDTRGVYEMTLNDTRIMDF